MFAQQGSNGMSSTYNPSGQTGRDSSKGMSDASGKLQADLEALRSDFRQLADQVSEMFALKGTAALNRARSNIEGVVSDAAAKGQDAINAARDVSDTAIEAIDDSLKKRPYTTLAIAFGIGFLIGTMRRH
jgi:ElaB/YqjD/DUF883 family membrane-anchored ribosome-binding protein